MRELADHVADVIRDIPDFPREGVLFKDITPILADPELFRRIILWLGNGHATLGVDRVVGMESRGFLFGAALAYHLGVGFAPARKKGKLPHETVSTDFELEYGPATLELHVDAVKPGERVIVVDDLLATGGTANATIELVRRLGGEVVACEFVLELGFLQGRARLDSPVRSLVTF